MIKNSEVLYSKIKIKKILKDRQIALKLFMNVMFGYTGASFSGRMPCCEIADAIVEVSKYLLRQSIDYLNTHPKYKGKVLYGDTDSIFFHLPGCTPKEAINIGKNLALEITGLFPYPI
jgi:DNA polymerase zeta